MHCVLNRTDPNKNYTSFAQPSSYLHLNSFLILTSMSADFPLYHTPDKHNIYNLVQEIDEDLMNSIRKRFSTAYISSRTTSTQYTTIKSNLQDIKVTHYIRDALSHKETKQQQSNSLLPLQRPKSGKIKKSESTKTAIGRKRQSKYNNEPKLNPVVKFQLRSQKESEKLLDLRTSSDFFPFKTHAKQKTPQIQEAPLDDVLRKTLNRLVKPLHENIAVRIMKDGRAKTDIDRALLHYSINKEFYETKLNNNEQISPEIQDLKEKRTRILLDAVNQSKNTQTLRVKSLKPALVSRAWQPDTNQLADKFHTLIGYARPTDTQLRPVDKTKFFSPARKSLELGTPMEVWKLVSVKKKEPCRLSSHQRELNRDEKKLRKIINLADYVGYS